MIAFTDTDIDLDRYPYLDAEFDHHGKLYHRWVTLFDLARGAMARAMFYSMRGDLTDLYCHGEMDIAMAAMARSGTPQRTRN